MRRVLWIALTWLVAVALPVQGVAAATMIFCGAQGRSSAAAHDHAVHKHASHHATQEQASHDHSVHEHGHDHASHHDAAHSHHGSHDGDPAASYDGVDAQQPAGASDFDVSCSVCASCCTAATLPSPLVTHGAPHGHAVYQATVASSTATFLTSGLDRPPRSTLD